MKKFTLLLAALLVFTAVSLSAQNAQTRLDNGKRLFDQQNYDGAIRELDEAIKLDPNMAEAYAYRSWAHGRNNNNTQALSDANKAIQLNSRLAMGYFVRGRLLSDNDRAIADYTEAIRLDPRFANAYLNRGNAYYRKNDYDRAMADYNEVIKLDTSAMAFTNRGNAYRNKNDNNHAIADYTEAIRLDPRYANAYYCRAIAYKNKNDNDHAIADYSEYIKLVPQDKDGYYNRGNLYTNKKDYNRAIVDFTEVIKIDPNNKNAYLMRSAAYVNNKENYEQALADVEMAIKLDSSISNTSAVKDLLTKAKQGAEAEKRQKAAVVTNNYDPSKFAVVPSDFSPADYEKVDLFKAVSTSKNLEISSNKYDAMNNQLKTDLSFGLVGGNYYLMYVSDVTFVRQNGTDITFSSDDNAISQMMSIDQRSGLQAGQRVRVYYTLSRSPLTTWDIIAIERR